MFDKLHHFAGNRQLELTSCNCDYASLIEWAKHRRGIKCWNGQQYIYVVDMDCTTGDMHHIELNFIVQLMHVRI